MILERYHYNEAKKKEMKKVPFLNPVFPVQSIRLRGLQQTAERKRNFDLQLAKCRQEM